MPWTSTNHETRLSPVEVLITIAARFSLEARVRAVPEMCDAAPRIRSYSAVTDVITTSASQCRVDFVVSNRKARDEGGRDENCRL